MPTFGAGGRPEDPSTCMFVAVNDTRIIEPPQCAAGEGLDCMRSIFIAWAGLAILIPVVFSAFLFRAFKTDALGTRHVWFRKNKERIRLAMHGPRALIVAAIFLMGVGRLYDKYHFGGPCRNDDMNSEEEVHLLVGIAFCCAVLPVCKAFFELTSVARKDPGDIAFTCSEQWRRKLINPLSDVFVTATPLLGALLFPQGFQESEDQGRTCLRGFGCETPPAVVATIFYGSAVFFPILLLGAVVGYCIGKKTSRLRIWTQWVMLFMWPLWLVWFVTSFIGVWTNKMEEFKDFSFYNHFTMANPSDIATYYFVPCFALFNLMLDFITYPLYFIIHSSTYIPARRMAGAKRFTANMGKRTGPTMFNNPSAVARKGKAGGDGGRGIGAIETKRTAGATNKHIFHRLPEHMKSPHARSPHTVTVQPV